MRLLDLKRDFRMNKGLYFLILPVVVYLIIFNYVPMAGIILGFERFTPKNGVYMSEWVGLKHFVTFFSSVFFIRVLKNTMILSLYAVIFGFPAPIIFALLLNELDNEYYKKVIQVVSYMPNFISTVVIYGIIIDFVASDGVITGIDQELYEAAVIDGANRWKQTIHVTIPGIMPTVVIMLIMRIGGLMNANQEKILLLYNPLIYETSDVIGTFVYRKGLLEADYGYSTAVGLFNSVVNVILLFIANGVSRKYSETSLF